MLGDGRGDRLGELFVDRSDLGERLRRELLDADAACRSCRFESAHDVLGQIDGQRHGVSLETADDHSTGVAPSVFGADTAGRSLARRRRMAQRGAKGGAYLHRTAPDALGKIREIPVVP